MFLHRVHVTAKWFVGDKKMRKTFVCGNWPQVQETSNPYSLQVEQKALKEETNPLEETGFESCGNWPKNHFKACKTLQLINACFRKRSDDGHYSTFYIIIDNNVSKNVLHFACEAQYGWKRIHGQHS